MTSAETDWAAQYSAVLDALESLLGGQPAAVADAVVPATPDWTVRQAVAHLAGTAADATTGRNRNRASGSDQQAGPGTELSSCARV